MSDAAASSRFVSFGLSLVFAGLFATTGCAPTESDEVESAEAALGEGATITFDGAWNERVSGSLQKGKKVRVVYDAGRLTTCRGDQNGAPAWTITGFWRIGDGPVQMFEAGGHSASGGADQAFTLDASGDLQLWFQNTSRWGCNAYDSNLGDNYHFGVAPAESEPGWIGNVRYAIDRMTCNGICESSLRAVSGEIAYDTWARQRAAIRALTFEVWKEGVTDRENPDLWRQLDVQVHSRVGSTGDFTTSYVRFDKQLGNNARYAVDLRALDPVPGHFTIQDPSACPSFELTVPNDGNGAYVTAVVELFITVNGVELRPAGAGSLYRVRYTNYKDLYAPCVH
ncbi:MAG: hypothetical protein K0S65_4910 [Labilithrix sp.]|nr:hypothetical protein [Labilithrix sp.]